MAGRQARREPAQPRHRRVAGRQQRLQAGVLRAPGGGGGGRGRRLPGRRERYPLRRREPEPSQRREEERAREPAWFALLGGPGALLFRLANTLDAMWGYRNERYLRFGWAAARIDDVLNFVPARLTALSYALLGHTACALRCWRTQAPTWDSPNAGPVMAAGAGALDLSLGGPAVYHGRLEERPPLGAGAPARAADIDKALALVHNSTWLWLFGTALVSVLAHA